MQEAVIAGEFEVLAAAIGRVVYAPDAIWVMFIHGLDNGQGRGRDRDLVLRESVDAFDFAFAGMPHEHQGAIGQSDRALAALVLDC